jgi:hypothetical protein
VGDLEGYLHFLTRDEGNFAARIKLDSNAVMSLVAGASSNQLIAETRDGGIYAISIAEASSQQQPKTEPKVESKPKEQVPVPEPAPSSERSIMFGKDPQAPSSPDEGGTSIMLPNTAP